MCQYLNGRTLGAKHKVETLVTRYGAQEIDREDLPLFASIPEDKVLVCVVENVLFDAAAVMYSQYEYDEWLYESMNDLRPKPWLMMSKAEVNYFFT